MFTNEQASDIVLSFCRRENHRYGERPVMRRMGPGEPHRVLDSGYVDMSRPEATLASGNDWIEVMGQLGCYGPQWEPTPVKRADPPPHYGYKHRPISRRYGRR